MATDFYRLWNFPNCLGALDGKHIVMRKPACSGSKYFNYKHSFSIVLLAMADSHYRFLFIDVGAQGRCSDAGIFAESDLQSALQINRLNIPNGRDLPGTNTRAPYYIIADDAFPLRSNIMKPFPQRDLTHAQRIYNYRLARARRCIEQAFGILAARFRVFLTHILVGPEKVDKIVLASCCLHNMLRTLAPTEYVLPGQEIQLADAGPCEIAQAQVAGRRSASNAGKACREQLCTYFNTPAGAVPWQEAMI